MDIEICIDNDLYDGCVYDKHHRLNFDKRMNRADIIYGYTYGHMWSNECRGKSRYYVTCKDEVSGYRTIYFLHKKAEV